MSVGECPVWDPNANALYWIDIPKRNVHRLSESDGARKIWHLDSEPGCIARCEHGLVVAMRNGIHLMNLETGTCELMATAPYDDAVQRFNDGRCDALGRFWVGTIHEPRNSSSASLFVFERGRMKDMQLPVTVSNGLAFSPDFDKLYHADTTAHRINVYDFQLSTATVSNPRLFKEFSKDRSKEYEGRPDGAAVDAEGNYWVAMYEGGKILRISPEGDVIRTIWLPAMCPTMVAFGGVNLQTLFVTTASFGRSKEELASYPDSGKVLKINVGVSGRVEPMYQQ